MNDQLIPVFKGSLNNEPTLLCNARDLHTFLDVGKDFSTWIKGRVTEYGFVENQDYIAIPQKRGIGHGRGKIDYHLTLDTAKETAMVERNEKGRQIRRYFIKCEKELHKRQQQALPAPTGTPIQLPRGIYCYPNNRKPYQAYVRLEGKKTFVGSFRTLKEALDAQADFIEKATHKTSLTAVPALAPGRYRCIVRPDGQMQFSNIEDKTLIDATAIRRLRRDMRYTMTVVMELHNRLRIVDGEENASRLDTPLSNITL
ncbi:antA/AntB antirepressor family protein [Salmonella enterica]|nr:antA/AntB antirepressor family protein [Salmonella enterica]